MEEITFLIYTLAVELPVALFLLRREDWWRVFLAVLAVNMVSHPLAWQLIVVSHLNWYGVEAGVVVFEMLALAVVFPSSYKRAIVAALLMNVASAAIGLLFF